MSDTTQERLPTPAEQASIIFGSIANDFEYASDADVAFFQEDVKALRSFLRYCEKELDQRLAFTLVSQRFPLDLLERDLTLEDGKRLAAGLRRLAEHFHKQP